MIIVDEQIPGIATALAAHNDVLAINGKMITNELLRSTSASTVIIRSITHVDATLIDNTSVTCVASATAGVDHIDIDEMMRRHIRVISAPGCNAQAVAEYVLDWVDVLRPTGSRTIGIVGFGNVGSRLARYARMRGVQIHVSDPPLEESGFAFPSWVHPTSLSALMEQSDVVSLHVPYVAGGAHPTVDLITSDLLHTCAPGSLIINSARGGIIDEMTLCERVEHGELTAVLDVYAHEPHVHQRVIDSIGNCTPHIAGYTHQAKWRGAQMILDALGFEHAPLDVRIPHDDGAAYEYTRVTRATLNTPDGFESLRRFTPLRHERRQLPTMEECNALHA